MSAQDDGGPFHPLTINRRAENGVIVECDVYTGASLRDVIAMHAMAGMLAHPRYGESLPSKISEYAYEQADSMLQARKEKAP